jgi:hypothetical protein
LLHTFNDKFLNIFEKIYSITKTFIRANIKLFSMVDFNNTFNNKFLNIFEKIYSITKTFKRANIKLFSMVDFNNCKKKKGILGDEK